MAYAEKVISNQGGVKVVEATFTGSASPTSGAFDQAINGLRTVTTFTAMVTDPNNTTSKVVSFEFGAGTAPNAVSITGQEVNVATSSAAAWADLTDMSSYTFRVIAYGT